MKNGSDKAVFERDQKPAAKRVSLASSFVKLLSGGLVAQLLVLIAGPLLSRLLTPRDFGALGLFLSITTIFVVFGTLRYDFAITMSRSHQSARYLFWLAIFLSGMVSAALAVGLYLVPSRLWSPRLGELQAGLWLIPLGVLIRCLTASAIKAVGKHYAFGRVGVALTIGRLVDILVKLALAVYFSLGWIALASGFLVGELVIFILVVASTREINWAPAWNFSRYRRLAWRHRRFPQYIMPAAICTSLTNNLPVICFFLFFDPIVAGFLELTQRTLGRPLSLFGQHFHSVFFQHSVDRNRDGRGVGRMIENAVPALFLATIVPFLLVVIWGPQLFRVVFGEDWGEAGYYASMLAPAWLLRSIAAPVRVFNTFERQSLAFRWHAVMLLVTGAALLAGCLTGRPRVAVLLLSLAMLLMYSIHLTITVRLSKASWRMIALGPARLTSRVLRWVGYRAR